MALKHELGAKEAIFAFYFLLNPGQVTLFFFLSYLSYKTVISLICLFYRILWGLVIRD